MDARLYSHVLIGTFQSSKARRCLIFVDPSTADRGHLGVIFVRLAVWYVVLGICICTSLLGYLGARRRDSCVTSNRARAC